MLSEIGQAKCRMPASLTVLSGVSLEKFDALMRFAHLKGVTVEV